jgi:hypothetical protein
VVQIIKFAADWVMFEHEGRSYSIDSEREFDFHELGEIEDMSFEEVKKKYRVELDSVEHE